MTSTLPPLCPFGTKRIYWVQRQKSLRGGKRATPLRAATKAKFSPGFPVKNAMDLQRYALLHGVMHPSIHPHKLAPSIPKVLPIARATSSLLPTSHTTRKVCVQLHLLFARPPRRRGHDIRGSSTEKVSILCYCQFVFNVPSNVPPLTSFPLLFIVFVTGVQHPQAHNHQFALGNAWSNPQIQPRNRKIGSPRRDALRRGTIRLDST